ncbi:SRPBCC domain-containing protein [Leucobacter rhizosphaerae]|uniref:SRPBCC domain-containing protein n=1 Tax=Leucobacter rhizosphaerae TaxID=2932245 RepID=A0ABY4FZD8_9MICO|nr:SRPBCC domain-containing protein [Leucobacter rhizosphaerae]UOQ61680.1 SRPBCC domain-containing protein [Leucobacter rhizosphaerae]
MARNRVRAPRAAVWATVIDPELRKSWWPELELEPRVGGAVTERWTETSGETAVSRDASGDVDVWVEGHAIGFRWSEAGDAHSTAVLVTLRSQGPETGITVTETGFDVLPSPAERAAASQDGWQVLLADLVASVEAAIASGSLAGATETVPAGETADAVDVDVEDDVEVEDELESDAEVEAELVAEAEAEAEGETATETGSDTASETAAEASPGPQAEPELEAEADTATDADTEVETGTSADAAVDDSELEREAGEEPASASESAQEDEPAATSEPVQEVEPEPAPAEDSAADPDEPDFDTLIRGSRPS